MSKEGRQLQRQRQQQQQERARLEAERREERERLEAEQKRLEAEARERRSRRATAAIKTELAARERARAEARQRAKTFDPIATYESLLESGEIQPGDILKSRAVVDTGEIELTAHSPMRGSPLTQAEQIQIAQAQRRAARQPTATSDIVQSLAQQARAEGRELFGFAIARDEGRITQIDATTREPQQFVQTFGAQTIGKTRAPTRAEIQAFEARTGQDLGIQDVRRSPSTSQSLFGRTAIVDDPTNPFAVRGSRPTSTGLSDPFISRGRIGDIELTSVSSPAGRRPRGPSRGADDPFLGAGLTAESFGRDIRDIAKFGSADIREVTRKGPTIERYEPELVTAEGELFGGLATFIERSGSARGTQTEGFTGREAGAGFTEFSGRAAESPRFFAGSAAVSLATLGAPIAAGKAAGLLRTFTRGLGAARRTEAGILATRSASPDILTELETTFRPIARKPGAPIEAVEARQFTPAITGVERVGKGAIVDIGTAESRTRFAIGAISPKGQEASARMFSRDILGPDDYIVPPSRRTETVVPETFGLRRAVSPETARPGEVIGRRIFDPDAATTETTGQFVRFRQPELSILRRGEFQIFRFTDPTREQRGVTVATSETFLASELAAMGRAISRRRPSDIGDISIIGEGRPPARTTGPGATAVQRQRPADIEKAREDARKFLVSETEDVERNIAGVARAAEQAAETSTAGAVSTQKAQAGLEKFLTPTTTTPRRRGRQVETEDIFLAFPPGTEERALTRSIQDSLVGPIEGTRSRDITRVGSDLMPGLRTRGMLDTSPAFRLTSLLQPATTTRQRQRQTPLTALDTQLALRQAGLQATRTAQIQDTILRSVFDTPFRGPPRRPPTRTPRRPPIPLLGFDDTPRTRKGRRRRDLRFTERTFPFIDPFAGTAFELRL